ncbi:MAG: sensor histidine kinase [bacterium]|nr:sensor histidine kinase [bacterium]MDT8365161.1 sensor histidine kinase [bacterium]
MNGFRTSLKTIGPVPFQLRLIILVTVLLIFMLGLIGMAFSNTIAQILESQIGNRALSLAQSVSRIPQVRSQLVIKDPEGRIQEIAEEIRQLTGAEFVVVGDWEGRRYSHPNPDRLGKLMVGGDNAPALEEGRSYVSRAVGTLGPSLRGKTPVLDEDGKVVGIVSVGYLIEDVNSAIRGRQSQVVWYIGVLFIAGVIGAAFIANDVKSAIFGLEPHEIARLFTERTAILETAREGIIAVNGEGTITLANQAALSNLGYTTADSLEGRGINDVFPRTGMKEVLATGTSILDREVTVDGKEMIFNILPITGKKGVTGVVTTFRRKGEIDRLAMELFHVREYSEMLRSQTHEYSNKLHTLAGLIQLESYSEALEILALETSGYQSIIHLLTSAVPDPVLSAIILGKFNRAQELKVTFKVDEESSLSDMPKGMSREKIITILGNLLDNALEAAMENHENEAEVRLSMTDLGEDIIIEVEDSGKGVPHGAEERIFGRGESSKKHPHSGIGLFLVKEALEGLRGHITIGTSEIGGALFTVAIPKEVQI